MRIKKKKINGYDVFIYNTKKYSTIHMRFLFELPYTRENIFKYDLLEEYMLHSTSKYKTRKEINDKRMELYSMNFGMNNYNKGVKMFTEVTFNFYDPKLVKDAYFKEALEFSKEILFHPNFDGGRLDEDELRRSKDNLITEVADGLCDYRQRARKDFLQVLFPNTYKTIDLITKKEDIVDILDSYSDEELIKAHEELVQHSLVGLIIMGNIEEEYLKYIEEIFKFKETKVLDKEYHEKLSICRTTPYYTKMVDEDYKESILRVLYKCPSRSLKDRLTYSLIARMFGSSGMLLHKILREEEHLVYMTSLAYNRKQDYMILLAYIDKENAIAAEEAMGEMLERLKDDDALLDSLLTKIKEENELDMYVYDENKWNPFYELYDRAFDFDISTKRRIKIMSTITKEDVKIALNKMKKAKIHLYEGAKK